MVGFYVEKSFGCHTHIIRVGATTEGFNKELKQGIAKSKSGLA